MSQSVLFNLPHKRRVLPRKALTAVVVVQCMHVEGYFDSDVSETPNEICHDVDRNRLHINRKQNTLRKQQHELNNISNSIVFGGIYLDHWGMMFKDLFHQCDR